jgi:ankyrin repeat protein
LDGDDAGEGAAVRAVQAGDVSALSRILAERGGLASARLPGHGGRTLLHVATDWPGHFPRVGESIAELVRAGADVNALGPGDHPETPLHWAASSDDVEALDALLDAGADIDAAGAVIGGGTALSDAAGFGQWRAAHRLIERGARAQLWEAAALGLMARVEQYFAESPVGVDDVTHAFWCACHGGQLATAVYLYERGADVTWVGYEGLTALQVAERAGATDLLTWLRGLA